MRTISSITAGTATFSSFLLVEIERFVVGGASVFYRYTNAPASITFNGTPAYDRPAVGAVFSNAVSFSMSSIVTDSSGNQATEIEFEDTADTLKALTLLYDFKNYPVRIWEAGVDANFVPSWIVQQIVGETDGVEGNYEGDSDIVTIGVRVDANLDILTGPLEGWGTACEFMYGSPRCGHTGASCDRSWTNCGVNGNQLRFGGRGRWAPAPGTKLYWGTGDAATTKGGGPSNPNWFAEGWV